MSILPLLLIGIVFTVFIAEAVVEWVLNLDYRQCAKNLLTLNSSRIRLSMLTVKNNNNNNNENTKENMSLKRLSISEARQAFCSPEIKYAIDSAECGGKTSVLAEVEDGCTGPTLNRIFASEDEARAAGLDTTGL